MKWMVNVRVGICAKLRLIMVGIKVRVSLWRFHLFVFSIYLCLQKLIMA